MKALFKDMETLQTSFSSDFDKKKEELENILQKADTVITKVFVWVHYTGTQSFRFFSYSLD